jgi:TolA-binding protein
VPADRQPSIGQKPEAAAGAVAPAARGDVAALILGWAQRHRKPLTIGAIAVALAAAAVWFVLTAEARKEAFAARALRDAQAAVAAGNLPLATSDLSRLVNTYRGTPAAEEAAILLGQLRLSQGATDSAIRELKDFLASGPSPRFRAAAQNLLGAALEQAGRFPEAAEAYAGAAQSWPYQYLQDQAWLNAARMFRAAGDTARAAAAYETILRQHPQGPSAVEARLRLAELRQGDVPSS